MRTFNKIQVCKRELEVIRFIQTGSNNFWESYYIYTQRKQNFRNVLPIITWFNSTIKGLHSKGLFLEVPFVYHSVKANFVGSWYGYFWLNPGLNGVKANYECFTLHDSQMEMQAERNKILV